MTWLTWLKETSSMILDTSMVDSSASSIQFSFCLAAVLLELAPQAAKRVDVMTARPPRIILLFFIYFFPQLNQTGSRTYGEPALLPLFLNLHVACSFSPDSSLVTLLLLRYKLSFKLFFILSVRTEIASIFLQKKKQFLYYIAVFFAGKNNKSIS